MSFRISQEQGAATVFLTGDIDLENSPRARQSLLAAVATGLPVVVDMGEVSYMDSSGIASLVEAFQKAKSAGRDFSLTVLERLRSSHAPSRPRTGRAQPPIPDAARLVDELIALVNAHRGDQRPSDDLTMTVVRREPSRTAAGVGGRA